MKFSFRLPENKLKGKKLIHFIKDKTKQLSQSLVYSVLLMYYAFNSCETPLFAKNIILGILGYFLAPIDSIPDFTPLFGFTDDLGVISFGLVSIACYIDGGVREKAINKMNWLYKNVDQMAIEKVSASL